MDLRLTIAIPGQGPFNQELIEGTTYTLGRSDSCDIVIASAYVSRTPIRVEWTGQGFDIVDTANRNPIVINGYALSGRRQIKAGDSISIGDVMIAVSGVPDPNATMLVPDPNVTVAPGSALPVPPDTTSAPPPMPAAQPEPPAAQPPRPTPVFAPPAAAVPPPQAAAPAPAAAPQPAAPAQAAPPPAPARPSGTDYGTLRVRNADGGVNEFSIDRRTVVVGRASGIGITIEDDIAVDRRHFQIRIDEGAATIEDLGSAGGTFLGSQRLQPNTIHRLAERQVIRFGNCEAELLPPGPRGAAKERASTVSVSLAPPTQPIMPGGTTTATVTVQNRGKVVDQISLRIPDIDPTWVELRRQTLSLVPGARDEVAIVFKPPKTSAALAGEHPFAVAAVSAESGNEVRALGRFTILPFESVDFSVRPKGKKGVFTLVTRNSGNASTAHVFAANDEEEALNYNFENEHVELEPGQEKSLTLKVKPKRRNPFGQNKAYRFALEARPEGTTTTRANASGTYTYRAPFRRWRSMLFPVITALGLGTVLIFARGNPATIIRWFDFGGGEKAAPRTPTVAPTTVTTTPNTPQPATAAPCDVLAEGCTAVVINSPSASGNVTQSCLRIRSSASRTASEVAEKLCDGTRVELLNGPIDAEDFRWWEVETADGTRGFVAERSLGGSGSPLDIGPWLRVED